MSIRTFLAWLCLLVALTIAGCGGDSQPVNKDRDMPKPATKDKK